MTCQCLLAQLIVVCCWLLHSRPRRKCPEQLRLYDRFRKIPPSLRKKDGVGGQEKGLHVNLTKCQSFDWCLKLVINSSDSCQSQKSLAGLEETRVGSRSIYRQVTPSQIQTKMLEKHCSFAIFCKSRHNVKVKSWFHWSKWRNCTNVYGPITVKKAVYEGGRRVGAGGGEYVC